MNGPCQPTRSVNVNMTYHEHIDSDEHWTEVPEEDEIEYDDCGLCAKYCGKGCKPGDDCDKEKKKALQDERSGLTKFELKYHTFSTEKTLQTSWVRYIPTMVIGVGFISVVSIFLGRSSEHSEDTEDGDEEDVGME